MLFKTHLAIGAFFALLLVPHVSNPLLFFPIVLIASVAPDVDSAFSTLGKNWYFRVLQWLTKHRGIFHSLSFCILLSIVLALIYPPLAFPVFLGYGVHLIADSFTIDGIRPFWPFGISINGRIKTSGRIEDTIFIILCVVDVIVLVSLFI